MYDFIWQKMIYVQLVDMIGMGEKKLKKNRTKEKPI